MTVRQQADHRPQPGVGQRLIAAGHNMLGLSMAPGDRQARRRAARRPAAAHRSSTVCRRTILKNPTPGPSIVDLALRVRAPHAEREVYYGEESKTFFLPLSASERGLGERFLGLIGCTMFETDYRTLSMMIAPAPFMTATGSLILSSNNRLAAAWTASAC